MTIPANDLKTIMIEARENDIPFFESEEIEYYYKKNKRNLNNTIYELLIIKSQDSTLSVSGLNTTDTSAYFKMLASKFTRFNSGVLR